MDPTKFDELTKALATSTSRRQALKTIAATTIGGILGLSGIGNVFAKPCTPLGRHCNRKSVCCGGGSCDPTTSKCACPPGTTLLNGACCPNANVCGTTCLAAPCDSSQCLTCDSSTGTCVSSCDAGQCQTCQGGTCASSCNACSTCQGGTCVSSCSSGQDCLSNGTCASPCTPGVPCSCGFCFPDPSGADYCSPSGATTNMTCANDSQCTQGYFCYFTVFDPSQSYCLQAC